LSPRDYDAVLFDLDGVLAKTANLHACAWTQVLEDLLANQATRASAPSIPFDIDADYARYVDGKSQRDGVAAFLSTHQIHLPIGAPGDQARGAKSTVIGSAGKPLLPSEFENRRRPAIRREKPDRSFRPTETRLTKSCPVARIACLFC
jgi:phosphoglycolate phosphatase-like HAD superfamily hydrolase